MAVAIMHAPARLATETYDRVVSRMDLDAMPAPGEILHIAAEAAGCNRGLRRLADPRGCRRFVERRLRPALAAEGHAPSIEVRAMPLHNLHACDLDTIERIGSVSLPAHLAAIY